MQNNKQEKLKEFDATLSEEERKFIGSTIKELGQMRDLLSQRLKEWNGMTYYENYEKNRELDLAYNPHILQDKDNLDFNITSGTTREKDTDLLSTLLQPNLKPNIQAFDSKNMLIAGLGEEVEDMITKSRELEMWDDKKVGIYRETLAQGTSFVLEYLDETLHFDSNIEGEWNPISGKIKDFKLNKTRVGELKKMCKAELIDGRDILVSNLYTEDLQNLAGIAISKELDRKVAEAKYGSWERWQYVPQDIGDLNLIFPNIKMDKEPKVAEGKVLIVKLFHRFDNRYNAFINGIPMLPMDYPMTEVSPSGMYPIAKGVGEVIPNFLFGKGIPSKTLLDQKLLDVVLRVIVNKIWQSYRPTLGNASGKNIGRDVLKPNRIIRGVKNGDFFPILPEALLQVSNSDLGILGIAKENLEKKTISNSFTGEGSGRTKTATEIVQDRQQQALTLTAVVGGINMLERQLCSLRKYNILANWIKLEDEILTSQVEKVIDGIKTIENVVSKVPQYRNITLNKQIEGKKGVKEIRFGGKDDVPPTEREIREYEDMQTEKSGDDKPYRLSFLNSDWITDTDKIWFIEMIPNENKDDPMSLLVFLDNISRLIGIFGTPEVFNKDYLARRLSIMMKEDPDKLFNTEVFQKMGQELMNDLQALQQSRGGGVQNGGGDVKNPIVNSVNSQRPTPQAVMNGKM